MLLARLVGFATVSRDSNLAMIDFIRDYLDGYGVTSELFYNAEGTKASLYATIGPRDRSGIALSGHTDVVPVDGQAWTVEPFRLTERDGRLYGRGTADMKASSRRCSRPCRRWSLGRCIHRCICCCRTTRRSVASAFGRCSKRSPAASIARACA
jgi:hypothetical protein